MYWFYAGQGSLQDSRGGEETVLRHRLADVLQVVWQTAVIVATQRTLGLRRHICPWDQNLDASLTWCRMSWL